MVNGRLRDDFIWSESWPCCEQMPYPRWRFESGFGTQPAQSAPGQASQPEGQEPGGLFAHDWHQDGNFPQEQAANCNEMDDAYAADVYI